jgi:outer membrane protein
MTPFTFQRQGACAFYILLAVLVFHSPIRAQAQEGMLSRQEAVARSLENNLGIRMARLQSDIAELNDSWGAAGALPRAALTATTSTAVTDQTRNPTAFLQQRILAQSVQLGGNINWTLFDGMGMFANKRALELLAEQSEGAADLLVEQTVQAVVLAYDAAVVQRALLATLASSMALSRERLEWIERRREAGNAVEWDRLQGLQGLLADSMAWLQQQQAWETARRNVNRLMGEREEFSWMPLDSLVTPEWSPSTQEQAWRSEMLNNGTAIRNAALGKMLAETAEDQAVARLYPVVGLSANFGDQRSHFESEFLEGDGRTLNSSAQLTLNFNLFNGGATRRAIAQARIQQEIAGWGEEMERQEAIRRWEEAWERGHRQEAIYQLALESVGHAERLVEIAGNRIESGTINALVFRDAQLGLQRAKVQEVLALQAWRAACYEIDRLRGAMRLPVTPVP